MGPNLHNAHGAQATWHVHLGLDYGGRPSIKDLSSPPPHCHTLTALSTCVGRPRSWRRAPPFGVEQHLLALMQLVLNVTHLRTTMRCWAGRAAPR